MIVVITYMYDLSDEWTFRYTDYIQQLDHVIYFIEKGHYSFWECKKEALIVMA